VAMMIGSTGCLEVEAAFPLLQPCSDILPWTNFWWSCKSENGKKMYHVTILARLASFSDGRA
jgi:hypothetical protein